MIEVTGEDQIKEESKKDEGSSMESSTQDVQREEEQIRIPSTISTEVQYEENEFLVDSLAVSFSSWDEARALTPADSSFCRICHQSNLAEPNLSPCNCKGSMALVHKSCLEKWLIVRDSNTCELCGFKFAVKRIPKYDILKAMAVWLRVDECRKDRLYIVCDVIKLLSVLPFICLANHQTTVLLDLFHMDNLDICDLFSFFTETDLDDEDTLLAVGRAVTYFLVGAVSAMDILTFGWAYVRFEEHMFHWQKWYRTQCVISLVV